MAGERDEGDNIALLDSGRLSLGGGIGLVAKKREVNNDGNNYYGSDDFFAVVFDHGGIFS